jgi:hypothetical protein
MGGHIESGHPSLRQSHHGWNQSARRSDINWIHLPRYVSHE